VYYTSIAQGL